MSNVYIILLNYCNYALTVECINSIKKSSYHNYKIIVVDNLSPDKSGDELSKLPDIHFIQAQSNGGFSSGNNIGILYALASGAEYIMLLNNDTVIDPYMLEKMMDCADESTVVVPKMYYFDQEGQKDVIWYAGGEMNYLKTEGIHIGLGKKDNEKYSIPGEITFATGCCMLIHKSVIEKVGLLDEKFFMYCEDTDYSIRLEKAGVRIFYQPEAKLWHKVSASSGGEMSKFIVYYLVRNKIYCARKNKLGIKTIIYIHLETINRMIKGLLGLYYSSYSVSLRAIAAAWLGRMYRCDSIK